MENKSEYLITGDNHLLRLGSYEGMRIIKVAEFLEVMHEQGLSQTLHVS